MVTDGALPNADAVANGGGVSSPQSRRWSLPSPWASVVRGGSEQNSSPTAAAAAAAAAPGTSSSPPVEEASASDNSLIESSGSEPQPESPETNGDSNAGGPRRTAWSRPLNGVVEPVSVMGGAVSWPALSETTRPVPRSLSDASRPVSDGSVPSSQAPIISQPPQRPASNSSHGNHSNHGNHAGNNPNSARSRQRNRGGGVGGGGGRGSDGSGSGGGGGGGSSSGTGPSQSSYSQPPLPMPPPFPVFEVPYGMIPAVLDNPIRGPRPIGSAAPQSHTGNDHSSQRGNARRGNFGPRPRGDGQYHNNHGGRRDQDRRDVHHPPQYAPAPPPMGYMPPPLPPGAAPFMAPPSMRVFPGQMGFEMSSPFIYVPPLPPDSFRAMPMVPPPPPMIFPSANEEDVTPKIVKQINFYFSDENLVRDRYLRAKMDENGWVPISVIASFRRVQLLTKDISLILDSLRYSFLVEVQGDKVRRRNDWFKWPLPSNVINSDSGSGSSSSAPDANASSSAPDANGTVHPEMNVSGESSSPSELANGDNTEEVRSSS